MKIDTKITKYSADVTISTDNATVTERVSVLRITGRVVSIEAIDEFLNAAIDLYRLNNKTDVEFVHYVYNKILNDSEKEKILKYLKFGVKNRFQ